MRPRTLLTVLFSLSILLIILALAYAFYDFKEATGLVHDPQGHPIPNAAVSAGGRSTLSDESGRFRLPVPRGRFAIIGHADGFDSAEQSVLVDSFWDKDIDVDLTLPWNAFTGTVVAQDLARPLAGASIRWAGGGGLSADAGGQFIVRGIRTGTVLEISAAGYRAQTFLYQADGMREFALSPTLTTVRLLDEYSQQPIPGGQVAAEAQGGRTNGDGQVALRGLHSGVIILGRAPGHDLAQAAYDGQDVLTLALRPNALDGVVKDSATDKPVPQALVLYADQLLRADDRGAFHIDKPSPALTLTVKMPGYRLSSTPITRTSQLEIRLQPFKAKGLHIYYAMPRDAVVALLDRLVGTEVNTVVLDVKEGAGDIVWPSALPLAKQLNAYHARGIPPKELVEICRRRNWYCIARQVIFKDIRLGSARPDLALHAPDGGVLRSGGEIWMNPAKKEVWEYNLALAKELVALGFDEVQFDYIRYPGSARPLEFGTAETRVATIQSFLEYASTAFRPLPGFFSADLFGLTVAVHDEQGIGQLLTVDGPYLDYVSPMMYPSTWKGSPNLFQAGLNNPNCPAALACPYEIIYRGTLQAQERGKTLVRPWLQAYADSGFGLAQYLAQKKGADDANSSGWLFWNNQGIYPDALFESGE